MPICAKRDVKLQLTNYYVGHLPTISASIQVSPCWPGPRKDNQCRLNTSNALPVIWV